MLWEEEFAADYAVPRWFDEHPDLEDTSWHNDVSPSFETPEPPGTPDDEDGPRVRVWIHHPDPDMREMDNEYRYVVHFMGEGEDADGVSRYCMDVTIGVTDDLEVVDCMVRWGQEMIAHHGIGMCPVPGNGHAPSLLPDDEILFDPEGRPNFLLPPLPHPCTDAAPREDVEQALEQVNRQRGELGLAPLDPASAGWTDEDVLHEAARIRLKNRLTIL